MLCTRSALCACARRRRAQCDVFVIPQLVTILPRIFLPHFVLVLLVVVGWWWWRPIRKVCSRRILGRGWPSLRLCWHLFDPLGAILGAMLVHLGTIWAHLGAMLTHLRAMSAQLAAHVGPPAMLGQLRRI